MEPSTCLVSAWVALERSKKTTEAPYTTKVNYDLSRLHWPWNYRYPSCLAAFQVIEFHLPQWTGGFSQEKSRVYRAEVSPINRRLKFRDHAKQSLSHALHSVTTSPRPRVSPGGARSVRWHQVGIDCASDGAIIFGTSFGGAAAGGARAVCTV